MFKSILILASLIVFSTSANDEATAKSLYEARGENVQNALDSANMYAALAAQKQNDEFEFARLKLAETRSMYYFGRAQTTKSNKMKYHELGYQAAEKTINQLSVRMGAAKKESYKEVLASAHYFYASHLGQWANANGKLASLFRYGELVKHLDAMAALGPIGKSSEFYGESRVRGRVMHRHPGKSNDKAYQSLKYSYENSLDEDFGLSSSTTTAMFYIDILAKTNKDPGTFCEIYDVLEELSELDEEELIEELEDLNPELVPEGVLDIQNFKDDSDFEEDVKSYARRNC